MRHQIEFEDQSKPEEPLTIGERLDAIKRMLEKFEIIKEKYNSNKKIQAEVDQCFNLLNQKNEPEKKEKLFDELKRTMIYKLGCKEEWFEDDFLRQLQQANEEEKAAIAEAKKRKPLVPAAKKKYMN